jgi:anaerobic ribonucleoside-triphosphate reductase activating protein
MSDDRPPPSTLPGGSRNVLRLGHSLDTLRPTLHNGPGWRVNLWVQGCQHRCTEQCLNPHFLDPAGGTMFPVRDVEVAVRDAARSAPGPDRGLTILGGEPFEQAAQLADLLAPLRRDGWSTMVYSGHTHEWLVRSPDQGIVELLAQTDILVDGPFLPHLYDDSLAWRGSRNQRLLCLTGRHTPSGLDESFARQRFGFSLLIGPDRVSVSGLQTHVAVQEVSQALGFPRVTTGHIHNPEES